MAEALSLVSSIIAVVGAAEACGQMLSKLKILLNAPEEISILYNDITDLTTTLKSVSGCISSSDTETSAIASSWGAAHHMSALVDRAREKILELNEMVHSQFTKAGSCDGDFKFCRLRWAKAKSRVESQRQVLRDIRMNIVMQMLVLTSSHQSRMRIMIDEVLVVADQIRTNQLHGLDWAHQLSLEQAKLISDSEPEQPTKSANPSGEQRSPCTEDAHITIGGSQANSRNTPVVPNASRNEQIRYSIYLNAVVPNGSQIFNLARLDDGEGLQQLFNSGAARPNDIIQEGGYSALVYATIDCNLKACKVLLQAGADPHHESPAYRSPFALAWDQILAQSIESSILEEFRALFPDDNDYLDDRQFSTIHKIVLGLSLANLGGELAKSETNPDIYDSAGRTALSWAVQREDLVAVDTLLKFGANPELPSKNGTSPLAMAAYSGNLSCFRLLLEAGSSVTAKNTQGFTVLHHAVSYPRQSIKLIKYLMAAGGGARENDIYGRTPLYMAVSYCNVNVVGTLVVDYGADVKEQYPDGDTPLSSALCTCNDDVVQWLLENGAELNTANNAGETCLHRLAKYGSLKTIDIFRKANFSRTEPLRIDSNAINREGKTAFQDAQLRPGKPEGFINLFLTFLFEMHNRDDFIASHVEEKDTLELDRKIDFKWEDEDSESDVFFDALEL